MHNSTELVIRQDDRVVTTSRLVAGKFEKLHKDVLKAIANLGCSEEFRRRNFAPSSYISEQNKELPEYIITRDGFSFLTFGFNGKLADQFKEDFINAFNKMENALKATPKSSLDLARESIQALTLMYNAIEQQNALIASHEERLTKVEGLRNGIKYYTIMGYAALCKIPVPIRLAANLGKIATSRCTKLGIYMEPVADPRFGTVNSYPESMVSQVFNEYFKKVCKAA